MAVINNGGSVEIDAAGVDSINNFINAVASNIKLQNNCIYTITTGAVGSATTGNILLRKTGSVANLESNHVFVVQQLRFTAIDTSSDPAQAGVHINFKGCKVIMTTGGMDASQIAPFKGNAQSQFIFKGGGTTWNAKYPDVEIDGSTFIYEGGGDGNFCKSPLATVKNITMLWTSTSNNLFVLGLQESWTDDNKPDPWRGITLQSIKGNSLIAPFSWNQNQLTNLRPNNAFTVLADWAYNVSPVGTRATALRRSYRRTPNQAMPTSYWGAVLVNMTYLWIDLHTTLSSSGVITTDKTYLRNIDYISGAGTNAGDTGDDIIAYRFEPTCQNPVGEKLEGVSIVVTNKNALTSYANEIGNLHAKLAASGITADDGQFLISEPVTKDYASNASHRTDSIVIRNRVRTQAWHKWWEGRAKLILICDSRSTTGVSVAQGYQSVDFHVSYRQAGSVFIDEDLDMSKPQAPTLTMSIDGNYNSDAIITGIVVTYDEETGITSLALPTGNVSLDAMWKALIDFHANPDKNEKLTIIPVVFETGVFSYEDKLAISGTENTTIVAGEKIKTLKTTETASFNTSDNPKIAVPYTDALGSRVSITGLDAENFDVTWHLRYREQAVGSTPAGAWTNVSGTGNLTTILAEIATYDVMIRVPGYDWKTTEIDTNETLSLDASLDYHVSANNTPQYTMSYDEDLEAAINFDYATNSVSIVNTTGAIINPGFAEFYQATQRIQHIPALVWIWESPVTANSTSQKILIPTGNAISFFLTEDSNASVKATCPVIHQASGQSADDRVKGNASGYSIILGSPATAESAGLQSAIVSELLEKLGGENYAVGTDSLKKIKDQLDLMKEKVDELENYNDETLSGKVDAVKAVVDALQNYNDTPTQDKLDAIKTAVDLLENYNDTVLVGKVDAIKSVVDSIKTTVEDKTGYALTTSQIELIATTVESHLLDEGDSQKLIEAIVGAIGNANIDETVLVAAIRSDIERAGGKLDAVKTKVDALENADFTATNAKIDAVKTKVDTLQNADFTDTNSKIDAIPTNPVLANDSRLDQLDAVNEIMPKLNKMDEGLGLISNFEPYDGN